MASSGPAQRREPGRGRPPIRSDAEILDAALEALAADGFEAMSVRALNRDLGLSHGTVQQRFGSKDDLYTAAIDHGFGSFVAEIVDELGTRSPLPADDAATVWELVRAFLVVSARYPALARLMNLEGLVPSARLDRIYDGFIAPAVALIEPSLVRLAADGRFRAVPTRTVYFLIAYGAAAPYALRALSARFDAVDGPLDDVAHAEAMADLIVAALASTP